MYKESSHRKGKKNRKEKKERNGVDGRAMLRKISEREKKPGTKVH
jgi:hypothetical protein